LLTRILRKSSNIITADSRMSNVLFNLARMTERIDRQRR
jgi:hypothetical protein